MNVGASANAGQGNERRNPGTISSKNKTNQITGHVDLVVGETEYS